VYFCACVYAIIHTRSISSNPARALIAISSYTHIFMCTHRHKYMSDGDGILTHIFLCVYIFYIFSLSLTHTHTHMHIYTVSPFHIYTFKYIFLYVYVVSTVQVGQDGKMPYLCRSLSAKENYNQWLILWNPTCKPWHQRDRERQRERDACTHAYSYIMTHHP